MDAAASKPRAPSPTPPPSPPQASSEPPAEEPPRMPPPAAAMDSDDDADSPSEGSDTDDDDFYNGDDSDSDTDFSDTEPVVQKAAEQERKRPAEDPAALAHKAAKKAKDTTPAAGRRRGFDELQKLYPNLCACVEEILVEHPAEEILLKRAFGFIGDDKAQSLESDLKKQAVDKAKAQIRRRDIKKDVLNELISLMD